MNITLWTCIFHVHPHSTMRFAFHLVKNMIFRKDLELLIIFILFLTGKKKKEKKKKNFKYDS